MIAVDPVLINLAITVTHAVHPFEAQRHISVRPRGNPSDEDCIAATRVVGDFQPEIRNVAQQFMQRPHIGLHALQRRVRTRPISLISAASSSLGRLKSGAAQNAAYFSTHHAGPISVLSRKPVMPANRPSMENSPTSVPLASCRPVTSTRRQLKRTIAPVASIPPTRSNVNPGICA